LRCSSYSVLQLSIGDGEAFKSRVDDVTVESGVVILKNINKSIERERTTTDSSYTTLFLIMPLYAPQLH
jgi:hypothetical protein